MIFNTWRKMIHIGGICLMNIKGMSYAQIQITAALLKLIQQKTLNEISITDITKEAGVGRASFYRNYQSKEDILNQYLKRLLSEWYEKIKGQPTDHGTWQLSLMEHYYENRDFYMALQKAGLSNLQLQNIIEVCGPKPEDDNLNAYFHSLLAYSVYGWIIEWISRGMQETPEQLYEMLKKLQ